MRFSSLPMKAVSLAVLVLHLLLPVVVHAHSQTLLQADSLHSSHSICLDVDDGSSHDETDNHAHDTNLCQLDTPFDRTGPSTLHFESVVGKLAAVADGRPLAGFGRRIYIPPRTAS